MGKLHIVNNYRQSSSNNTTVSLDLRSSLMRDSISMLFTNKTYSFNNISLKKDSSEETNTAIFNDVMQTITYEILEEFLANDSSVSTNSIKNKHVPAISNETQILYNTSNLDMFLSLKRSEKNIESTPILNINMEDELLKAEEANSSEELTSSLDFVTEDTSIFNGSLGKHYQKKISFLPRTLALVNNVKKNHIKTNERNTNDSFEESLLMPNILYLSKPCVTSDNVAGSCFTPEECYRRGGRRGGDCCLKSLICCLFEYYCGDISSEGVVNFRSPDYPLLSMGSTACDFDLVINPTVCAVRIEFIKVKLAKKLGGVCDVDQFVILNSVDGPTIAQCGDLTSYSTTVAVVPGQKKPLKLALLIQNEGYYFWDIRLTQLKCSDLSHFRKPANCGSKEPQTHAAYFDVWNNIDWQNIEHFHDNIWWNFPEPVLNTFFYGTVRKQMMQRSFSSPFIQPVLEERIVGGSDALLHEFPWQVAIFIKKMFFCGGAIINEEFVLTAAHCFLTRETPASELIVFIGDHDLTNSTESKHVTRRVKRIYFHSHFHPFLLSNDIALLQFDKPVSFSRSIRPVCLPNPGESYIGRKATVVGWGITSFPMGQPSATLQKLEVKTISNHQCSRIIEESVTLGMICASPQGLQGTCFGDSGGPLTLDNNGREILIGIVSFGVTGCAVLPGFPDLYTRVAEYLTWVDVNTIPSK